MECPRSRSRARRRQHCRKSDISVRELISPTRPAAHRFESNKRHLGRNINGPGASHFLEGTLIARCSKPEKGECVISRSPPGPPALGVGQPRGDRCHATPSEETCRVLRPPSRRRSPTPRLLPSAISQGAEGGRAKSLGAFTLTPLPLLQPKVLAGGCCGTWLENDQ